MTETLQIHPFEKLLNDFLDDTMARWFKITNGEQRVGLSIQLHGAIQNKTPTREKANYSKAKMEAHYRNSFCKSIYNDNETEPFCNNLDYYLKKKISPDNQHDCISCRCHKGVSNILIPYRYPKDMLGIVWYIYIGQFLLMHETTLAARQLVNEYLSKFKIVDVNIYSKILDDEAPYIQPNVFISKSELHKYSGTISKVTFLDFLRFREYSLTRFQDFLDSIYKPQKIDNTEYFDYLKDYVKEKEDDSKILDLMKKIYHILTEIPNSHPLDGFSDDIDYLKERFELGKPENLVYLRDKYSVLSNIYQKYQKEYINLLDAKNCIMEIKNI